MLKKITNKKEKTMTLAERLTQLLSGDKELERMAWCMSAYLETGSSDSAFLMM